MMASMNDNDQRRFGEALRELAAVHRIKYSPDMFRGYWAALKDITLEDFEVALADLQKYSPWMPKPSEFRAALRKGWL
jgi:hypothetical protein